MLNAYCCALSRYLTAGKQAVFTGKQQRDGVAALPFIVPGLFAFVGGPCTPASGADDVQARSRESPQLIVADEADEEACDSAYDADNEAAAVEVDKAAGYNWTAYHAVWHETPFDSAVTALFAEYASLYSRISGQVRSCVPPPMTLSRGLSISEQASRFVTLFVNPILGEIHSTKVHKLLCHVMSSIRWHGDLQNANTADNEAQHKHDKPFYSRTNKHLADFTRQLVVHARGSHAVLRRLDAAERTEAGASSGGSVGRHQSRGRFGRPALAAAPCPPGSVAGAERTHRDPSSYHLQQVTIDELEARPDLSGVGALLGMSGDTKVRLVSHRKFSAVMDCGTRTVQTMHASNSYYDAPWYDAVLYEDGGCAPGSACVGVLRAVLRMGHGDVAVLADMQEIPPQPRCPLQERGCTRLAWRVLPDTSRIVVRVVPLSAIRRVVLLMPDYAELSQRCGVAAAPPRNHSDQCERLKMRFFVNDFHPWRVDGRR